MMGMAQYSLEVPVIKGTSGILVMQGAVRAEKRDALHQVRPVRGGLPDGPDARTGSADYAEMDNFDQCDEYGVKDCMECGACAYVCDVEAPDRAPGQVREAEPGAKK